MCKNQKFLGADMQKDLNWMAGSISRKPRGVRAKFWADLELILKAHGPQVDSHETEGLLSKTAGQRGMFCSGLLDLDRMAQNRLDLDLISFAGNRSDGQDQAGARGGGAARRSSALRRRSTRVGGTRPSQG